MAYDDYQNSEYGGNPILIFRFYAGARTWLYCNQKAPETRGSDVYLPLPISMGPTSQSAQEAPAGVEINLPSNDPLAVEFKPFLPPDPIQIDVYTRHRNDPAEEYRTVFIGECAACNFNDDGTATITCYPLDHNLDRVTPWPVYCAQCNWAVYSVGCGVDPELFKTVGTVSAISANQVSAAAFAPLGDGWFSLGYVVRVATGDRRWVINHVGDTLTLSAPFLGLGSGETLHAFAGCDGLELTCKDKFNNLPRHVGFNDVPRKNPFTENVFGTTKSSGSAGGGGKNSSPRIGFSGS